MALKLLCSGSSHVCFKTYALDFNLREFVSFDRPFERGFSNIL